MSAIAAYRTAIGKILDDASAARFTADQVDQGLRAALNEYNRLKPLALTYNVSGCGEYVFEMPADFQAVNVYSVELHDENTNPQIELLYHAYKVDESWFMRTFERLIGTDESIDVFYTGNHTIDGLDSAAGTTVPEEHETALQLGAAGYAAMFRAVSRSESVNLQPDVAAGLQKISSTFLQAFRSLLRKQPGSAFAALPSLPTDTF